MKKIKIYILLFASVGASVVFAQRGKDGNVTVNTANRIVNEYTTLTANVAAGAITIPVAASGLNANSRFAATLAPGDLIMIIQMQGATINGTLSGGGPPATYGLPNDETWGAVTAYNNCGNYEFAQVSAVPNGTSITIDCGLTYSYTAAGKTQIIRVPRYNTLTITSPGTIIPQTWNGSTGGVVSIEVLGNTVINAGARIDATAQGFRGGALFTTTGRTSTTLYSCLSLDVGTNKGEGIAGYDTDYTPFGGKYCRGSAANAGGGGNVWNCGGGGGANAGNVAAWTGQGNPNSVPAGWATAWNLESPGFSTHTSSGGGRGGYSFSNSNQNATTLGPGTPGFTNAWGGSYRYNQGGLGGRPLDYSTGRIFMGGGGGAGEQDNNRGGTGGRGAGIVYLMSYGTVSGAGSIVADGEAGASTPNSAFNPGVDGAGGGGGGGTIIINSVGTISGITASANGGVGGNQVVNAGTSETEGPGGGGGGGYIAISNGAITQTVNGGANGTTNSSQLTEFTANGATAGGAGLSNQTITNFTFSVLGATICAGNTATLTVTTSGTVPGGTTYSWFTTPTGGSPVGTGASFTTPALFANTSYYVQSCPGTYRIQVDVTVTPGPTITVNSPTICAGQTANLTANGGTTYTWTAGATSTGVNTANASPVTTTTYTVTGTTAGCSGTAVATVTVTPGPTITVNSPTICNGQTANLTAVGGTSYTWTAGATSTGVNTADASPSTTTTYTVTGTTAGCSGTAVATVTVTPLPTVTVNSPTICPGQTANLSAGGATSYTWSAGATATGANTADASPASTTTYTVTGTTSGCSNTAVATVTVSPGLSITVNSPTICAGQTANLTANGGTTYTWTAGATSTGVNTADASPSTTTTYTVTGSTGACSGTAIATVTVTPLPTVTVNSPTICAGQTANLTAGGATSYTWSAGATATGVNTADASPAVTTTYTVTGTSSGCSNTAVATVTVGAALSITVNSPTICAGQTASLTANGGTTYTWSSGATSTGANTADVSPASTTTYTVTGTTGGCSGTAVATVTVNALPTVSISGTTSICAGQSTTLTASGAATYSWSSGASTAAISVSPGSTTTYTVTGTDANTCTNTATQTVTVTPMPIANAGNDITICAGTPVVLSASGGTNYSWSNGALTASTTVSPATTTSYIVTVSNGACTDADTVLITVNPAPTAVVSADVTIVQGTSTTLTAGGGGTYLWTTGETTSSINVSPSQNTQYCVTVSNGICSDSACVRVFVDLACGELFVPNAFSPNNDGYNDFFRVKINVDCVEELEFLVYDRWGEKVYEANTIQDAVLNGWDGNYNGKAMDNAVFVYYLKIKLSNQSQVIKQKGNVSLIR